MNFVTFEFFGNFIQNILFHSMSLEELLRDYKESMRFLKEADRFPKKKALHEVFRTICDTSK